MSVPLTPELDEADRRRFERLCGATSSSGCRPWLGALSSYGYGLFWVRVAGKGRQIAAHRAAYYFAHGAWPTDGLQLDHECHSRDRRCAGGRSCPHRRCVEPSHLAEVTSAENTRRGRGHGSETHCPAGHEYTPENTYVWGRRKLRSCRLCHAEGERRRREVLR